VLQGARGFRVAPLNYGGAPQLNPRGFVTGWKQVGENMQELGGALGQIGAQYQHAKNVQHIADAEISMDQATNDIHAKLASDGIRDKPDAWVPAVQQHVNQVGQQLLSNKDLSPLAKQQIEMRLLKWGTQLKGQTNIARISRQFDLTSQSLNAGYIDALNNRQYDKAAEAVAALKPYMAEDALKAKEMVIQEKRKEDGLTDFTTMRNTALNNRNIEGARQSVAWAKENGFLDDKQAQYQYSQIDATHAVNQQKDEFQAVAIHDPQKALADLNDPNKFHLISPGDRAQMEVIAKSNLATQSSDAWHDLKTRIDLGQVKKDESFDAIKELDPLTRDVVRLYNRTYHDKASMNSPSEYEAAISAIDNAQDDGSGLVKAQLGAGIESRFNGAFAAGLNKRLEDKFNDPSKSEILKEPLAQLNRWAFDEKRLGEYQKPEVGPDGNPVVTEKTIKTAVPDMTSGFLWWRKLPWMGGPVPTGTSTVKEQDEKQVKPVMQDDPAKRDKIAAQVGNIRMTLEKEASAGKFATPEDAMKRMADLAKIPLTAQAANEAVSVGPSMTAMPSVNGLKGAPLPVSLLPPIEDVIKKYAPNPGK